MQTLLQKRRKHKAGQNEKMEAVEALIVLSVLRQVGTALGSGLTADQLRVANKSIEEMQACASHSQAEKE